VRGKLFVVVGAVSLLFGPLAAWSQPRNKVAVMPPEGDAPAPLAEQAAAAVAAAAAATGREVVRLAVPLQEVLLTVECPEPTAACTAVAGHNLGVEEVLQVRLRRKGSGWRVEVALFDVIGARVARRVERQFAAAPSADELGRLGRAVFEVAAELGPDKRGQPSRAAVQPLPTSGPVKLGQPGRAAVEPPAPPPSVRRTEWRLRLRPRTWVAAAAGAGLLIAGGVLGGLVRAMQSDFNSTVLPPQTDVAGMRHYVNLADKGKTYALGANVCFGLGAATLAVSGVFFSLDWRKVEVQPMAGPRAAGLTLRRSF
jgi:hypothetical protein